MIPLLALLAASHAVHVVSDACPVAGLREELDRLLDLELGL